VAVGSVAVARADDAYHRAAFSVPRVIPDDPCAFLFEPTHDVLEGSEDVFVHCGLIAEVGRGDHAEAAQRHQSSLLTLVLEGSWASMPERIRIARRRSATFLAMGSIIQRSLVPGDLGSRGTVPKDGLKPTILQNAARVRTDPASSVPSASDPMPEATAVPAPSLDPPTVRPRFQGLLVKP